MPSHMADRLPGEAAGAWGVQAQVGPDSSALNLKRLCQRHSFLEAFQVVLNFEQQGVYIPARSCYYLIEGCIKRKDLKAGRKVHSLIKKLGYRANAFLGSHLIRLFSLCGSLWEANDVFNSLPEPDAFAWSAIISANVKFGQEWKALTLFSGMQQSSMRPDAHVLSAILKACTVSGDIKQGKLIHAYAVEGRFDSNISVGNVLIDFYAKCASLDDAHEVFETLVARNVVTWGAMIAGYVHYGYCQKAFSLFNQMQVKGLKPNNIIFASILKACSDDSVFNQGQAIHMHAVESDFELDNFVGSSLIEMYAKYGSLDDAWWIFKRLPKRDVVTWTIIITAYSDLGCSQKAFWLFHQMRQEAVVPNKITFISIFKGCSSVRSLMLGRVVYAELIEANLETDVLIGSTVIDFYAACSYMEDSWTVFQRLPKPDLVSWHTIISGFVINGQEKLALHLFFHNMQFECSAIPNQDSFVCALQACSCPDDLLHGKLIHSQVIESNFNCCVPVINSLINMYLKCGSFEDAWNVFGSFPMQDVVTWGSILHGCVQYGYYSESIFLLLRMQKQGLEPEQATLVPVLKAWCMEESVIGGNLTYAYIVECDWECDICISNILVDMYGKCGKPVDARTVFERMVQKDVVTWTALIDGYVLNGLVEEAIRAFADMEGQGIKPNKLTFVSIIGAFASVANLQQGRLLHSYTVEAINDSDVFLTNTLINMYFKCGTPVDAQRMFNGLSQGDAVTWNTMIAGCAQHNEHKLLLQYFEGMQKKNFDPDSATFSSLLGACSHMGLVKEGCQYFMLMQEHYAIVPMVDHYIGILDLFSRSGCLEEALGFLEFTPFPPDNIVWTLLLAHCKTHRNVELARRCFDRLIVELVNGEHF